MLLILKFLRQPGTCNFGEASEKKIQLYSLNATLLELCNVSLSGVRGEARIAIEHICFPLCGQMLDCATHSMEEINCYRQLKQVVAFFFKLCLTECNSENYHPLKLCFILHLLGSSQGLKLTINIEKEEYMSGPSGGSGMLVCMKRILNT